jgi:hypothetical protein
MPCLLVGGGAGMVEDIWGKQTEEEEDNKGEKKEERGNRGGN